MRMRVGFVIGFGVGYYLGAMGGRERYEQINRMVRKVKRSEMYETATGKAKSAVDTGFEKAKDLVDLGNGSSTKVPKTDPPIRP